MTTTRFAPAPTGHLHLGHVVNAICVWETARQEGARVLLRIEDHDRQRSRPEFEASILEDLAWLGFVADGPPVRQSARDGIYRGALDRLRAQGRVYACECSRQQILEAARRPDHPTGRDATTELWYPGTCASKSLPDAPGRTLRVRLPRSEETFDDLLLGLQTQVPSDQCGDLVVRDRHGNWTYQFAVTVDDFDQDVSLVIRGVDLLASTGRQMQLARMLGRAEPPRFMHHPLLMKSETQKLSKSDRDTGIRDMRAAGVSPAAVIALARRLSTPNSTTSNSQAPNSRSTK